MLSLSTVLNLQNAAIVKSGGICFGLLLDDQFTGGEANYVVLENTGELTVVAKTSAKNTTVDAGGKLIVQKEAKTDTTRLNNGGILEVH
ncbi:AIDA repeat-containing protein, partial [Escherichia coli]|uniref:AIDA repeat-containing protein n=1 Tax=Escherichia coli TaxID=562 RepID=UPI00207B4D89